MTPTPVSKPTIENFLLGKGISYDNLHIPDGSYMLPAKDWIANEFAQWFKAQLEADGLSKYQGGQDGGKWTCTKFATDALADAMKIHAKTAGVDPDTAAAFGEFRYVPDGSPIGHAINFAVCRQSDGETLELVFFEPQNQTLVNLSDKEIQSCESAYF